MKGKLLFMAGFGTGFVLGSKQGRGPYEKLEAWWQGRYGTAGAGARQDLLAATESTAPDAFGEGLLVVESQHVGTETPRVSAPSDTSLWADESPARMR